MLLHILQHVESLAPFAELAERLRPLADLIAPPGGGRPDMISLAQAGRALRRGGVAGRAGRHAS